MGGDALTGQNEGKTNAKCSYEYCTMNETSKLVQENQLFYRTAPTL